MADYLTHLLQDTKERFAAATRNFRAHHICPVCDTRLCLCTLDERRAAMEQRRGETVEEWQDRLDLLETKPLTVLDM